MMSQETSEALVDKTYLLEKFSGKGGWTFARIPEVLRDKSKPFGWVRVKGSIDGIEIKGYHLMPMGDGHLFLPVKSAIRKQIKKKAGDWIQVKLYADNEPIEIPANLLSCFDVEPGSLEKFRRYNQGEQRAFINWIDSAKTEETKTRRIVKLLNMINRGLSLTKKLPSTF